MLERIQFIISYFLGQHALGYVNFCLLIYIFVFFMNTRNTDLGAASY